MDNQAQTVNEIAQALFTVNRHAKTAPDPRHLYTLKKRAIHQLLNEKKAKKVGLHFSDHPKKSHQHSTLLVKIDNYYFHIPPQKADFKELEHLGNADEDYRNPKTKMPLSKAKRILYHYLDWHPEQQSTTPSKSAYNSNNKGSLNPFSPWGQMTSWTNKKR